MPIDDVRFRCDWRIAAPTDAVRAALADVDAYPRWWPSIVDGRVRGAEQAPDGDGGWLRIGGRLPYSLRVRLTRMDAPRGVLAARIHGDMLGWCTWHVTPVALDADGGEGSRVIFQQHVILRRRTPWFAMPLSRRRLRANHDHVMRAGEVGLRRLLER